MAPTAPKASTTPIRKTTGKLTPYCLLRMLACSLSELSEAPQFTEIEPDKKRLADNIRLWHEAPYAAVAADVAVVAHHEVMIRRDGARHAVIIVNAIFPLRELFYIGQNGRFAGVHEDRMLGLPQRFDVLLQELDLVFEQEVARLFQRNFPAVYGEALVLIDHFVSGQADDALDVIDRRIFGVAKHHHVAPFGFVDVDDLLVDHRQGDNVGVLVDQDEIPDQQGRNHRARRDLERLDQKGAQHEHDKNHWKKTLRIFDPPRLFRPGGAALAEIDCIHSRYDARDDQQTEQQQCEIHLSSYKWRSRSPRALLQSYDVARTKKNRPDLRGRKSLRTCAAGGPSARITACAR